MKKITKLFAIVLSLAMVMGMMPVFNLTVSAAEVTETVYAVDNGRIWPGMSAASDEAHFTTYGLTAAYGYNNAAWNPPTTYNGESLVGTAATNPKTAYHSFVKVKIPAGTDMNAVTSIKFRLNVFQPSGQSIAFGNNTKFVLYALDDTNWTMSTATNDYFGITTSDAKLGDIVAVSGAVKNSVRSLIEFDVTDYVKANVTDTTNDAYLTFRVTTPNGTARIYSLQNATGSYAAYAPRLAITKTAPDTKVVFKSGETTLNTVVTTRESFTEGEEIYLVDSLGNGGFYTVDEEVTVTLYSTTEVSVTKVDGKYAVSADGYIENAVLKTEKIFCAATKSSYHSTYCYSTNADGETISNGGSPMGAARVGVLEFNIDETMADKAVYMNLYTYGYQPNGSYNNHATPAAYLLDGDKHVSELNGTAVTALTYSEGPIYSLDQLYNNSSSMAQMNEYVRFDITEAVNDALDNNKTFVAFKILLPHGGMYFAGREQAGIDGDYSGKAAYLNIVESNTVDVIGATKITKMGTDVTGNTTLIVPVGSSIKLTNADAVAFTDLENVYLTTDGVATITPEADCEYGSASFGVDVIKGAQVRIGAGVDSDGKIDTINGGSGLRFIGTRDNTETDLTDVNGATFGLRITAEGSESYTDIPAEKWQDETESVFTAALTNLVVNNYNRNFTATPYVTIGETTYLATDFDAENTVTRSIYKVAAGLLAQGYTESENGTAVDPEDHSGAMPEVLVKVLNAYVNQTGIRLTMAENAETAQYELTARTDGSGCYTHDAFFTVGETAVDGTKYSVVLTPVGSQTTIMPYWNEYIRINNNNSQVKVATELTDNQDGTFTLTFDLGAVQ